ATFDQCPSVEQRAKKEEVHLNPGSMWGGSTRIAVMKVTKKGRRKSLPRVPVTCVTPCSAELVHGVVLATSLEGCVTVEELFMVITDVGASHVLVLDGSDTLANFATLDTRYVGQHAFITEVALGQVVGRECRG